MTRPILAAAALLAMVAGCSAGSAAQTASPTAPATVGPMQGGTVQVSVASSSFGDHLTAAGKALYVLTTDGPNSSSCLGDCAANWPPLVVDSVNDLSADAGITGTLGMFARGTTNQVTINGMPLYYFAGDTAATDVKGQGQGGVWFLAAPAGGALRQAASPPASTPTPSVTDDGDGYPYP